MACEACGVFFLRFAPPGRAPRLEPNPGGGGGGAGTPDGGGGGGGAGTENEGIIVLLIIFASAWRKQSHNNNPIINVLYVCFLFRTLRVHLTK